MALPLKDIEGPAELDAHAEHFERFDLPDYADESFEELGARARRLHEQTDRAVVGNFLAHLLAARGFTTVRFNLSGGGMRPGEDLVSDTEAFHRDQLNVLADRHHLDGLGASIHMVSGEPGVILSRLADRLDIGLIVMGTVARTGVPGFIMGNTAETILNQIDCSVLAIKPPGFVTPVTIVD